MTVCGRTVSVKVTAMALEMGAVMSVIVSD